MSNPKKRPRFRVQYEVYAPVYTPAGSPTEPEWQRDDSRGYPRLVQVGERDIRAEIKSFRDGCDLHALLQRYAAGDPAAAYDLSDRLAHPRGAYFDVSGIPGDLHALDQLINDARTEFQASKDLVKQFGTFDAYVNTLLKGPTPAPVQVQKENNSNSKKEAPKDGNKDPQPEPQSSVSGK